MTLSQAPLLTDGASHPAQQFRLMTYALARGNQGISQGADLKVTQEGTPGAGVQMASGTATINGQADAFQGAYTASNVGADTIGIASTGGSTRYDMVVLRVLDPEYEGSLDPATDQIVFFDIVSNVASTATQPPAGMTAIPLARIAIPPSTSTITNAMITDLRQLANPRTSRSLYTYSPSSLVTVTGTQSSPVAMPSGPTFAVPVPAWATSAKVSIRMSGIRLSTTGVAGNVAAKLGSSVALQSVFLDDNSIAGIHRVPLEVADSFAIPVGYRGTNQNLTMTIQITSNPGPATAGADASTTFIADVEFLEGIV
jgi:hypothetical protein